MSHIIPSIRSINKFPSDWGELVFPISMSRIDNAQSASEVLNFLLDFSNRVQTPTIGVNIMYTEGLYMNFEDKAYETKNKYIQSVINHKNAFIKGLGKNVLTLQIQDAYKFHSWFQIILGHKDFLACYRVVKDFYEKDNKYRDHIQRDIINSGRELTEQQLNFFLEEHTFAYLLVNNQIQTDNKFVQGRGKWTMICYPGKPLYGQIYLLQADPLDINKLSTNPFKGHYDLTTGLFYDFTSIDLNSLEL